MLRELEQCVEERDRLTVNISATPFDVSQLSPMTQSAQTVSAPRTTPRGVTVGTLRVTVGLLSPGTTPRRITVAE